MRVKNRSGKRDFKYEGEQDYVFLRGRDTGLQSVRDLTFYS